MESQIKNYLHIQQIKKLRNEINIIKKHKNKCKLQDLIDFAQKEILKKEELILNIIGIYDNMKYYYCMGNTEKLKSFIKEKENDIENNFPLVDMDKYYMMISR